MKRYLLTTTIAVLFTLLSSVWPKTHKALIMSKKALKNAVNFG